MRKVLRRGTENKKIEKKNIRRRKKESWERASRGTTLNGCRDEEKEGCDRSVLLTLAVISILPVGPPA
jgi:hypothetical protein